MGMDPMNVTFLQNCNSSNSSPLQLGVMGSISMCLGSCGASKVWPLVNPVIQCYFDKDLRQTFKE